VGIEEIAAAVDVEGWERDALCIEYPAVNFFPVRGEPTAPAKAVCALCLVLAECRAFIMAARPTSPSTACGPAPPPSSAPSSAAVNARFSRSIRAPDAASRSAPG
jgi:hypothetical protein